MCVEMAAESTIYAPNGAGSLISRSAALCLDNLSAYLSKSSRTYVQNNALEWLILVFISAWVYVLILRGLFEALIISYRPCCCHVLQKADLIKALAKYGIRVVRPQRHVYYVGIELKEESSGEEQRPGGLSLAFR